MTLIETLVAMFLTSIVIFAGVTFMISSLRATTHNLDRQFATQKAISMLEELKSLVQVQGSSVAVLDAYDDGQSYSYVLTTDRTISDPVAPASGNAPLCVGLWKYKRQVTVSMLPGTTDNSTRLVNVRVCMDADDNGDGTSDVLAEVAGIVRTIGGSTPPTQVYDVYALALENVPGWWVYMSNLIPFVQNAFQDIQSRNPGLEFRVHWITKLAYGRDMQYRPFINKAVDSNQPINWVYFYPGSMPSGSADDYYYPPQNFKGHILVDSTDTNGYDATANPNPYALADQYNNAMRYPDELALFNQRVASGQERDDAPTMRILLERMYQDPFKYRNAIFINLHGELFPFPPVRNYSDAAKEPSGYPNIRAVTHPEYLRYQNNTPNIKLRVYSYRMDPDNSTATQNRDWLGQGVGTPVPIVVTLKGISWTPTPSSTDVVAIVGGTDQDGVAGADAYNAVNAPNTASGNRMYYTASTAGGNTILRLYNSPLKTPPVLSSGVNYKGLNSNSTSNERLYGLEYIPSPLENLAASSSPATPFSINLTATHTLSGNTCNGGNCDKNTARWIITIPASVLPAGATGNEMITVETRIDSTTSGTRTDEPPNLSRTYVWKGTDTWLWGDGTSANLPHMPITEQFQFMGDPRHCPYADLKMPHQGSGLPNQNKLGMGYNRYFDDFQTSTTNKGTTPGINWQGWYYTVGGTQYGIKNDATADNESWTTLNSRLDLDVHRIFQVFRNTLKTSRSVFTTVTGFSFYYLGVGGEIGYDSANGFANSIPISAKPYNGSNSTTYEQSIIHGNTCSGGLGGCGVKYIRSNAASNYWWGINWIGELYPDSAYTGASGWATVGNLPTGTGSTTYSRIRRDAITPNVPAGSSLVDTGRMTDPQGCTALYFTGSANSTFHHIYSDGGTGTLQTAGTEIGSNYRYPVPTTVDIFRPFNYNINDTSMNPDHFLQSVYGPVMTAGLLKEYYDQTPNTSASGSALMTFADTSNNVEFVVVNGIARTASTGSNFIAYWSLLSLIHSFFEAGRYNSANAYANHVEQVPVVTITSPDYTTNLSSPTSITVIWSRAFTRWDGVPYTSSFPANYTETTPLSYTVMYSADNGATWKYMQDDTAATPGVRPLSASRLISSTTATNTYYWTTPPATIPEGNYIIRVECYRDTLPLHYSYHQFRAFIKR